MHGVATANSVLVVSFARERMNAGDNAFEAALQAGFTRLRPVLMTALAMIIGMIPMALGLGTAAAECAAGAAVIGACYSPPPRPYALSCRPYSRSFGRASKHPIYSVESPNG
jgi:multidrug efflux pump subunit AcrB